MANALSFKIYSACETQEHLNRSPSTAFRAISGVTFVGDLLELFVFCVFVFSFGSLTFNTSISILKLQALD